jgi:hypothetical protein
MSEPFFLTCLVLVLLTCALCASVGFNRPSWSRSYTTAARYRTALGAHVTLYLLLMLIIYAALRRGFVIYQGHEANADQSYEVVLVWFALVITLCVQAISTRPRAWLQRMAGIPGHAKGVAALLAGGKLFAQAAIIERARSTLLSRGIDSESDWLPLARPAHRLLLRATALFVQIREWEDLPGLAKFACEAKHDLDLQRRRFDRLSIRVSRTLASIERLGEIRHQFSRDAAPNASSAEVDGLIKKIVGDLIADSCEDIGAFYDDACLLAVRGAMTTEPTRKGRRALIRHLGFFEPSSMDSPGYGILAAAGLLLYAGVWLIFLILPSQTVDIPAKELIAVISLIVFGSISIAVVPKLRWGFANTGLHDRTPVAFVLGAGSCALLFAVVVQLGAGALLIGGVQGALERLHSGSPWLCSVFGTGASLAWLVQDNRWLATRSARTRRFKDAAILGSVWVLGTVVGKWLDLEINHHVIDPLPLLEFAATSFMFGALIGYAVPECIRVDEPSLTERTAIGPSDTTLLRTRPLDV